MNKIRTFKSHNKQAGASLLIFAIIALTVAGGAYFVQNQNAANPDIRNSKKTSAALALAKHVLENYSISYDPASVSNPAIGRLPFPDRFNDGDFDGFSDCSTAASLSNDVLIGRFPFRGTKTPCTNANINADLKDSSNNQLWYVVATHMLKHANNTNFSSAYLDPNLATYPGWLTLYDESGNIISDRVAFIVFAPGTALSGQNRSNPGANNFLDSFNVQGQGNISNAVNDLRFVKANETSTFNDRLIYMTIDELMPKLERRVLNEFRVLLNRHLVTNNEYPLPTTLTDFNHRCDTSTAPSPGYGFIADKNNDCPSFLTVPVYLAPWLDYMLYEPRADCVNGNRTGCNNKINGLTVNGVNNIDYVLISSGFHPPGTFNINTDISDSINRLNNQTYITPALNQTINRDQILFK